MIESTGWQESSFLWVISNPSFYIKSIKILISGDLGDVTYHDDVPDTSGFYPTVGKLWKNPYIQMGFFEVADSQAGTYSPWLSQSIKIEHLFTKLDFPTESFNSINVFLREDQYIKIDAEVFNTFDFATNNKVLDFA